MTGSLLSLFAVLLLHPTVLSGLSSPPGGATPACTLQKGSTVGRWARFRDGLELRPDGGVVCRALEPLEGAEEGGSRKPQKGDEVEIQWEGRAGGIVVDQSRGFESLVVGGSLRCRVPVGVETLVREVMVRGSSFWVSVKGRYAKHANGSALCQGAAEGLEYQVGLRDIHARGRVEDVEGMVVKTFGGCREGFPSEVARMQDGGVAKALVESRVWWCPPRGREGKVPVGAGSGGAGDGEDSSSGGEDEDEGMFVVGNDPPAESKVVRGMREMTFTMGGTAFPSCVYDAMRGDSLFASNSPAEALEKYRGAYAIAQHRSPASPEPLIKDPDTTGLFGAAASESEEGGEDSEGAKSQHLDLVVGCLIGRANAHRVLGSSDCALQAAEEAVNLRPTHANALLAAALAAQAARSPREALAYAASVASVDAPGTVKAAAASLARSLEAHLNHARKRKRPSRPEAGRPAAEGT